MKIKLLVLLILIFSPYLIFAGQDVNLTITPYFEGEFNVLRNSVINPNNITGQKIFKYYPEIETKIDVPSINNFYLEYSFRVFYTMGDTKPSIKSKGWKFEYTYPTGLFTIGLYNDLPLTSNNKIFKVSNIFELLYRSRGRKNKKTYLEFSLFTEHTNTSIIYAPFFSWLIETNRDDFLYKDISSLYYISFKYFKDSFDLGVFFAFEEKEKFNVGLWWQYGINDNVNIYGDILWSTRKWTPHLIAPSVDIEYKKNIGLMVSAGISSSFEKSALSIYFEALYNADGYLNYNELLTSKTWYDTNLLALSDSIMSSFLSVMDFDYMNMFSFAFHLRSDKKYWDFFLPEITILYYVPSSFNIRPVLTFDFDFNLKIKAILPVVFSVSNNAYTYANLHPFIFNPKIEISYSIYI